MTSLEDKFLLLTQEWYETIGHDHHKDQDCHFKVVKVWSYGKEPYYTFQHYGYLYNVTESVFKTYEDALSYGIDKLRGMVEGEQGYEE